MKNQKKTVNGATNRIAKTSPVKWKITPDPITMELILKAEAEGKDVNALINEAIRRDWRAKLLDDPKETPRIYISRKLWAQLSAYCDETGYTSEDLAVAGLKLVFDRMDAGQEPDREPVDAKAMKLVLYFEATFPSEWNALFMQGNELYLAQRLNDEELFEAGKRVNITEAPKEFFHPATVKEVLAWFAKCSPWSDWGGTIGEVCEMAAKAL